LLENDDNSDRYVFIPITRKLDRLTFNLNREDILLDWQQIPNREGQSQIANKGQIATKPNDRDPNREEPANEAPYVRSSYQPTSETR
jgi:hypothetical protein